MESKEEVKGQKNQDGNESAEGEYDVDLTERIQQILDLPADEREALKNNYPSRIVQKFQNGIQVTSNFDGGNLMRCDWKDKITAEDVQFPHKQIANVIHPNEEYLAYDMWICPDSWPYLPEVSAGRAGFFFAISGFKPAQKMFDKKYGVEIIVPRTIRINLKNMSNQAKLLSYGHKPVFLEVTDQQYKDLVGGKVPFYRQRWKRLAGEIDYFKSDEGLEMIFHHPVDDQMAPNSHIFFAYIYPYNYQDMHISIREIEAKCQKNPEISFNCECIAKSFEDRPLYLLTLASKEAIEQKKKTVFLTCRVHCGETPGSYMLQGVLDMLTDFGGYQSQLLLKNYVWKIIPMLNPDGVSRGYWRFDTFGVNLNRCYKQPTEDQHPTIFATKKHIVNESPNLKMYVDFHAHCTKRGTFIFGNTLENADLQYEAQIIPKLMSLNCVNFDFRQCSFDEQKLNVKDKKGDSRDGSGRAVIFKETGFNPLSYTFEANYCTGHRINTLSSRFDIQLGKRIIKEENPVQDTANASIYGGGKVPIYTQDIYADVGQSLLTSLLDYDGLNPISRIIKKKADTLEQAIDKIKKDMKKADEKPSIGAIKKKLGVGKKKKGAASSKFDNFELCLPTKKEQEQPLEEEKIQSKL